LTDFQITVKSASGKVESEVTGQEEYEIDTFEGLTPETREFLVYHKLTTASDLARFSKKWQEEAKLEADQVEILKKYVERFEKEEQASILNSKPTEKVVAA
jgi:hypothetical protein